MDIKNLTLLLLTQLFFLTTYGIEKKFHRVVVVNTDSSYIIANISTEKSYQLKNLKDDLSYSWYRKNQIYSTYGNYGGALLDGDYCEYDLNGQLMAKGIFIQGLRHKKWFFWTHGGGFLQVIHFKYGRKWGKSIHYSNKGKPYLIINYRKGLKNGLEIKKNDGIIISKKKYVKGKLKYKKEYKNGGHCKKQTSSEEKKENTKKKKAKSSSPNNNTKQQEDSLRNKGRSLWRRLFKKKKE